MWFCNGPSQSSDYYIDVSPPPSQVKSTSTITITCYQDSSLTVAIPSQVKWTKTHQGWSKKLPDISHAYVCKPTDIGSTIQAQVTARGGNGIQRNSYTIKFGPIILDPIIRPSIQNIIKNSIASFAIIILSSYKTKQYVLHITDSYLQIKDARTGNHMKSTYSAIQPEFIENTSDSCVLTMMIPKDNQNDYDRFLSASRSQKQKLTEKQKQKQIKDKQGSLQIRFNDRQSRDLFIIARKVFVVKRQMRLMSIIQNSLDPQITNNNSVDLLIEVSTIKALNEFLSRKKQLYKNQVDILQEEIQNVKNLYQGLLKQKNQHQSQQKPKFDPLLSLLDSSNNSRNIFIPSPGKPRSIISYSQQRATKIQTLGQNNQVRDIKVNTSQNVIYSQVYPFNDSYSKRLSSMSKSNNKFILGLNRHNTISQKQSSLDSQSILDSHHHQFIKSSAQIKNQGLKYVPMKKSTFTPQQQQHNIQLMNREQLYSLWKQQAHSNFILRSRIQQLERQPNVNPNQGQQYIIKQNDQLNKLINQKDGVIRLLVSQNNNLKLQLQNNNLLMDKYKQKCNFLYNLQGQNRISRSIERQSQQEFYESLIPYLMESDKLTRESRGIEEVLNQQTNPNQKFMNLN